MSYLINKNENNEHIFRRKENYDQYLKASESLYKMSQRIKESLLKEVNSHLELSGDSQLVTDIIKLSEDSLECNL